MCPNWCSNWVEVTGPKDEITRFKADAKDEVHHPAEPKKGNWPAQEAWTYSSDLSLAKLVPYPKEGEEDSDWYHKRLSFWGTKWDVDATLDVDEPEKLCYNFESAWSPPMEAFTTISKMYPTLTFTLSYDEPGMCFFGKATFINGDVNDEEGQYVDCVCSKCGKEQSMGPQGNDTECYECGASAMVTPEEYEKLKKEKSNADLPVQS